VDRLKEVLAPGSFLHATTDQDDYARHMVTIVESAGGFINIAAPGTFQPRPAERPLTRFERRSLQQGHEVRDLIYKRL
jgi:tRNA (guanine-N7-)-methyltransferase